MADWTEDDLLDPAALPAPEELRRRHVRLLLIDEGLGGPECFSWLDDAPNGPLAHWDGGGDHYFARFQDGEALLWGFDRSCAMAFWQEPDGPDITRGLPARFQAVLDGEPDPLYRQAVTFVFWHEAGAWHRTRPDLPEDRLADDLEDPQGARRVLAPFVDRTAAHRHVIAYHERPDLLDAAVALLDADAVTEALLVPFAGERAPGALLTRARALDA